MSSKTPYKVLCVCLGNICRSPTAEVVLKHFCDEQDLNIIIDSAGTSNAHPDQAPDLRSQQHAAKRGYDLSTLRARQLQLRDFMAFDLILAMDLENLAHIEKLKQIALDQFEEKHLKAKIALMSQYDTQYPQQEIPDPYYGDASGFERVLDQCESSSQAWVNIFKTMNV
ncbi:MULTISPECIES: low molecular weight protein-tyrosine-phosphatase [unclassified Acinetobacter]|uniref:low molecular weight protein-tyrosine-phosphatase n=1 Tax=unclassified Acinetobacter TaxID=196816 RepID=UPI00293486DB|nr:MULTISPECIES: low molecular weight protein-tyrosine-phosphatase [unclassified Acinetobacter]WOE32318.1 low molecular weight protein-tyrosine-phosphatase [Acinetobacter sp. SAAs470]WOE37791.1 low molecular weight protein-tyrosine-phosphatase [Acinetobacter sp. SAAs474]